MTEPNYRSLIEELVERLEWYINEDDTIRGDYTLNGGTNWTEENAYWIEGQDKAIATVERARKVLNQPVEEIDEKTATLIPWLLEAAVMAANINNSYAAGQLTLAAQLLGKRRPAPQPIPVSERLPGEGKYIPDPGKYWCWGFSQSYGWRPVSFGDVQELTEYWLPYWALPIPTDDSKE